MTDAARPLTRSQRLENAQFLKELRRTGNAREAARRLGAHRAKFTKRRAKHPAFAAQWDAALALAQAALSSRAPAPALVRRMDGTVQVRRARVDGLGAAARTRFLAALCATANVRLAAKAAGHSHAAFYHHKRRDPAFAREWRLALETGYERLECALLGGWSDDGGEPEDWQRNEPPPIPPMSPGEALQLLYLHQKEVRFYTTPEPLRRLRGETTDVYCLRLHLLSQARLQRDRERYDIAEAARRAEREAAPSPYEPGPPVLPDLTQVTGWSKASGKPPHDASKALFGGWRIDSERR